MLRLLIITRESQSQAELCTSLSQEGFACSVSSYEDAETTILRQSPDIALLEMSDSPSDAYTQVLPLVRRPKQGKPVPVIAIIPVEMLKILDGNVDADDFITASYDIREIIFRIQRILNKAKISSSADIIQCDDLTIDLATCEVAVGGRIVELTFKEYELLKLLASHRGRVYTRDNLLNKIWGYDYFGGDRTVDVHIRRLRSKIEDSRHNFIETVRNIGYRFRKSAW